MKQKANLDEHWLVRHSKLAWGVLAFLGGVASIGWGASKYVDNFATDVEVGVLEQKLAVNEIKVDTVLDIRIEQLIIQIDRLKRKSRTADEERALQDLEKELELARRMRNAK